MKVMCVQRFYWLSVMWRPLGEDLLEHGYGGGEARLPSVLSFLALHELTCLDDSIGHGY